MLNNMDEIRPSFIDDSKLVKLTTDEFIAEFIKNLNHFPHRLINLDLSDVDFLHASDEVEMDFDGWEITNVIFSRFNPKNREKKHLYGISFKGAVMNGVGFAQAFLDRCNFDSFEEESAILKKIDFFFSEFSYCRFRGCNMNMVDFRYAKVSDCSMNKTDVTFGDFYCCDFRGCTAFVESNFTKCSFTNAVFEHQVIRFSSIHGILQDNIEDYCKNIFDQNWIHYNPCGKRKSELGKKSDLLEKDIREEAIEMYKQLSGIYAGKGLNKDSNAAYKEMKKRELRRSWNYIKGLLASICGTITLLLVYYYNSKEFWILFCYETFPISIYIWESSIVLKTYKENKRQNIWNIIINNIGYFLRDLLIALLGYGYMWSRVVCHYVLIIMIGAYKFCNESIENLNFLCNCDCSKTADIAYKGLTFSVYNSVGSYIEEYVRGVGSFFANTQTILSFLLIGYLGFIFANKMRNNL